MTNVNEAINTDTVAMVKEFMVTGGQTVREYAEFDIPERRLRTNLVWEEVEELINDGFGKQDLVEVIDACADIVYVAVGGALAHGFPIEVRKNPSVTPVAFENTETQDWFITRVRKIMASLAVLSILAPTNAERELNYHKTIDFQRLIASNWEDLIEICYEISLTYGVDLDIIINEVQESNMSKFKDENGNFVVLLNSDGKIQKAGGYFKPRVVEILASMGIEKPKEV